MREFMNDMVYLQFEFILGINQKLKIWERWLWTILIYILYTMFTLIELDELSGWKNKEWRHTTSYSLSGVTGAYIYE